MTVLARLTPRFAEAPAHRIGVISLASDETCSDELRALLAQPSLVLHETRIANADKIDEASLAAMESGLTGAAALLPAGTPYDAVAYLCTSGSVMIGFGTVETLVGKGVDTATVTNPMLAGIRACRALGARRIALVTPYIAEVTARLAACFGSAGVEVVRSASFLVDSDARVALITPEAMTEAACSVAAAGDVDAVFLSCTALATVRHVASIERAARVPVLSSNQTVAWDLGRLTGIEPVPGDWGRLFDVPRDVE